jgi:hypothetical protein
LRSIKGYNEAIKSILNLGNVLPGKWHGSSLKM